MDQRVTMLNRGQVGNFRSSGGSHRSRLRTFRTPSLSAVDAHKLLDGESGRHVDRRLDSKGPFARPASNKFTIHRSKDMPNRTRCLSNFAHVKLQARGPRRVTIRPQFRTLIAGSCGKRIVTKQLPPAPPNRVLLFALVTLHHNLLPRCYQDRTNQPHLPPPRGQPGLLLLVALGCLRLDSRNFVNRRSPVQSGSPAPYFFASVVHGETTYITERY
jgi:hypothetical protein